jgi:class 3 adenylate cyclase
VSRSAVDLLQAARDAMQHHAWQQAYDALMEADTQVSLSADDLELLGQAAWWTGQGDGILDAIERAYRAYLEEGNPAAAAFAAFELAEQHMLRMSMPMVAGWLARAGELAEGHPEYPVTGYLVAVRAFMKSAFEGAPEEALGLFDEALDIAARTGDRNLYASTLHDKGVAVCGMGRFAEGLAMIDEAMVAVVGGELKTHYTGRVYCSMIGFCSHLGDYRRAAEWTEATLRWCERQSITGFPGMCRIHRAELHRLHGDLSTAEQEARQAAEELPRFNLRFALGDASYEIGEVRRRMGDLAAAEEAYTRAGEHGRDPEPGLSLLRLAQGKVASAAAGIRRALADPSDPPTRLRRLVAQADIALAAEDVTTAESASAEVDSIVGAYEVTSLHAAAARIRGAVRLAGGDAEGALPHLQDARRRWQELDAPFEVAEVRVLMGRAFRAMGDEDAAVTELRAACAAFDRLGARLANAAANELLGELAAGATATERVTRAFMFTDIVKSTDLVSAIGDEAWEDLLRWHDQTLRGLFATHGGEVAHHTGDGFFVAFADARSALAAAVGVQRALAEHRRAHGFAPQVRIGVHAAEATRRGGDYSGGEVHKAARIAAAAGGGEILASEDTLAAAGGVFPVSEPLEISAKGIPEPVRVANVEWRSA